MINVWSNVSGKDNICYHLLQTIYHTFEYIIADKIEGFDE